MKNELPEDIAVKSSSWLKAKLDEMDQKLDHIIYRLSEEDARTYRRKNSGIEVAECDCDDTQHTARYHNQS